MDRWRDRVAVVTGASGGIGAACCKYLVENGMVVVGLARRKELIDGLRSTLTSEEQKRRLHAIKCDVRMEADVCRAFAEIAAKYGPIAVLVNNAGIFRATELLGQNNTEDLTAVMETNVMGVAWCTREAFRAMCTQPGDLEGHVFIINSIAGHQVLLYEGLSTNMYSPSKYALRAATEVYRHELRMRKAGKIRVTSISPGAVDTAIFTDSMREEMQGMPFLRSEDIADALIYCLQTPPHVQIHEMIIKPMGETL